MGRFNAEQFVADFGVAWPNGYGLSKRFLAEIGCLNSGQSIPGYEVVPTLFLLDGAGRVLWNDGKARYRHRPGGEITRDLDRAVAGALEKSEKSRDP